MNNGPTVLTALKSFKQYPHIPGFNLAQCPNAQKAGDLALVLSTSLRDGWVTVYCSLSSDRWPATLNHTLCEIRFCHIPPVVLTAEQAMNMVNEHSERILDHIIFNLATEWRVKELNGGVMVSCNLVGHNKQVFVSDLPKGGE